MATLAIAKWSSSLTSNSLPPSVLHAALRSFYNWAGCTVGGSIHPATTIALTSLRPFFGAPTSSLLGTRNNVRIDAQHAALLNGIASHVHDYDDTHLETIIHPTGPVAAALLAYAQTLSEPVSGMEFLTALTVGVEVECKAGLAVWPGHYNVGWHITSTTGSIGAAAALARLMGLSPTKTAHAIGLAATQVTGLREMFGSHTKSFHPGRAAQNGILAAVLAANGYTSSLEALEAKRGWANVVGNGGGGCDDSLEPLRRLVASMESGQGEWEVKKNSFKPFPCGIVIHPAIDGCVALHDDLRKRGLDANDITSVAATVHPLVLELTGKTEPRDGLEAKFSVYHGGAVGLLHGKATPAQYDDAVVTDPEVVAIRSKITATTSTDIRPDECRIIVEFGDKASRMEHHVEHAIGSLHSPMTDSQLTDKFLDQCNAILGSDQAEKASEWCWDLPNLNDVRQIGSYI